MRKNVSYITYTAIFLYSYIHILHCHYFSPKKQDKKPPSSVTPRIGKLLTKHVWIKAVVPIHVACRIAWSAASCWRRTRKTGMPVGRLEFSDGFPKKNGVKIVKVQLQLRQIRGITWCFFFFLSYFFGSFFGFKVCRGWKGVRRKLANVWKMVFVGTIGCARTSILTP